MENILNEFLKSEKSLYLFAGIIGVVSMVVGLLFLLFSNHKSFALTMLIIGVLEMVVMFPSYHNYQNKIDSKISFYENNINDFEELESANIKKELNSFFLLMLVYSVLIVVLTVILSRLSYNSILFGIFTALILHLAFAITIDNFGARYTKKYLTELTKLE
ncbi:hypothetical protein [Ancylomarina sp. 16SWW S1-10-2]|uniref:hypothetical protein n=1 Tax=Ancylomarina sp. 16SWW S1-10-2 TaxID=2499681 RepID=UPI0012AD90C9|nr:hypothetical protein [Ancylomarina sp. 16SWW S1-10-2]MRT91881.1 hypothetical protein [Ancylomarina sp. 16SWW S1-10-2]